MKARFNYYNIVNRLNEDFILSAFNALKTVYVLCKYN